jgi:pyruvate dehydrogenase E1 component alpha subunit
MSTPAELQRRLLFDLLRVRRVEEAIAARYPEQQMRCPTHLSIGQEATAVGVCAALTADEIVLSGHRSHGHYLAKGGDLHRMIAELYGRATGCCKGKGGSMHLIDQSVGFLGAVPIVSSTIPIAVGAAFGHALRGEPRLVTVFFGDAAVEEGVTHEAFAFALLERLPVLFVCENNLYSVQTPLSARQPNTRSISDLARGHGMRSQSADGNDVFAVFELAQQLCAELRAGAGPAFVELATYRWLEHVGPYEDSSLGYRDQAEMDAWKKRCPVAHATERLKVSGVVDDPWLANAEQQISADVEAAFAHALQSPYPDPGELLTDIYPSTRSRLGGGE